MLRGAARPSAGTVWMLGAAASFTVMAGAAKMLPAIPTMEKIAARSAISVLLTLWALRRAGAAARPRRPGRMLARALLGFASLFCYFESIARMPLGAAVTVYNTAPLWAGLVGLFWLGEPFGGRHLLSVLVGLAGVALIGGLSAAVGWGGIAFGLACAMLSATAYTTVRLMNREGEHPMTIVLCFPLIGLPLATLCALLPGGGGLVPPRGWDWLWIAVMGFGTQGGQVCLTYALRHLTAARATQIGYVGVIFAMALGAAMGDPLPGWVQLTGAALIFASLVAFQPRAAPATSAASASRE
jgi:drug/metabolite transporter (DMT)-like permease